MEWLVGLGLLIAGWFFVVRNVGDTNLKRVRATNWMLERYALSIREQNQFEYNRAVDLTIYLKIGIDALKTGNRFLVDDKIISIFKHLSENDEVLYSLLKHTPEKINEFKYAFRDCHERLLAIANSDSRQS
ncbi:hypothetical protein P5704_026760 (plasmid) [Pseudomonas sp. FeN3W]|nr:hypothetical protein P5704_026760 [Pseudomonas sp. FeN3W]